MKLKPLDDRVIITQLEAESTTPGGIIIPERAKEKQSRGKVVAVGPGKRQDDGTRQPPDVAVGQTILYGKYAGSDIEIHGEKFVILRSDEIAAILED